MTNKMQDIDKKALMTRIIKIRTGIIRSFPFYGELILHLKIAFGNVGTAATDMTNIIYDPKWISKLDDDELAFLTMHELMHCVLEHPVRGVSKLNYIYNIAADIVVNSHILYEMGLPANFKLDGETPMHISPDGQEGRLQTAEEVYQKLISTNSVDDKDWSGKPIDRHDIWKKIDAHSPVLSEWKERIKSACEKVDETYLPKEFRNIDFNKDIESSIDWRSALKNYFQKMFDGFDYNYMTPDRRFMLADFILPGFNKIERDRTAKVLVMIDTSASMSDRAIKKAYSEIKYLIEQFGESIEGELGFFDNSVSEITKFVSTEELLQIKPVGGRGTSFRVLFKHLSNKFNNISESYSNYGDNSNKKTDALIIITDGYAYLPAENEVDLDIPVLWILIETDIKEMAWGESINVCG